MHGAAGAGPAGPRWLARPGLARPGLARPGLARAAARTTCVSVQSSVIGISVTPGCQRSHSAAVAADSGSPDASMLVRTMCVAKSLSPRLNQSGPDQPEPAL